ncbi:hypothetical protein WI87_01940 [Burkholderia ubonensis]|uniref:hypothetical protein n=1 Tax=Burkholderia ubonensis TaxID=101571 RepID=UPI00076DAB15|nr:hypothetical protein [Burkholderia ubonensis]KVD55211.1 hypothetical protein WI87_01940 [Burkholderia ubonensis]
MTVDEILALIQRHEVRHVAASISHTITHQQPEFQIFSAVRALLFDTGCSEFEANARAEEVMETLRYRPIYPTFNRIPHDKNSAEA